MNAPTRITSEAAVCAAAARRVVAAGYGTHDRTHVLSGDDRAEMTAACDALSTTLVQAEQGVTERVNRLLRWTRS